MSTAQLSMTWFPPCGHALLHTVILSSKLSINFCRYPMLQDNMKHLSSCCVVWQAVIFLKNTLTTCFLRPFCEQALKRSRETWPAWNAHHASETSQNSRATSTSKMPQIRACLRFPASRSLPGESFCMRCGLCVEGCIALFNRELSTL